VDGNVIELAERQPHLVIKTHRKVHVVHVEQVRKWISGEKLPPADILVQIVSSGSSTCNRRKRARSDFFYSG